MTGNDCQETVEAFLDLVGWKYSKNEKKRPPMAKELEVLGVVVDLTETHNATILVKNKEGGLVSLVDVFSRFQEKLTCSGGQRKVGLRRRAGLCAAGCPPPKASVGPRKRGGRQQHLHRRNR